MLNIAPLFPFFKASNLKKLQTTNRYCCRGGIHCSSSPEPLMIKDINVKVNKQKSSDACPAQLMLIAIKCPLIQRQAALAAIPLLSTVQVFSKDSQVQFYKCSKYLQKLNSECMPGLFWPHPNVHRNRTEVQSRSNDGS